MAHQCNQTPVDFTSCLSDTEVIGLNTYDFMAHVGKRVINPGGVQGRDQLLALLEPSADTRILELGCGNGSAACYIARRYRCQINAIDISPAMIERARQQVREQGLEDRVQCDVGNVLRLPYPDASFDYVLAQAVLMFVDQAQALAEIRRVLKPGGRFVGLEFSWRKVPPAEVREHTYRICGCKTLEFYSAAGWGDSLHNGGVADIYVAEHPFVLLSVGGFLRDEGLWNSLKITGKLLGRRANRIRMIQIWSHFAQNLDYFSYVVLAGAKPNRASKATGRLML